MTEAYVAAFSLAPTAQMRQPKRVNRSTQKSNAATRMRMMSGKVPPHPLAMLFRTLFDDWTRLALARKTAIERKIEKVPRVAMKGGIRP